MAKPASFHGRSLVHLLRGEKTQGKVPPAYAEMLPCTAWQKNERVIVDNLGDDLGDNPADPASGAEYAMYAKYTDNLFELYSLASDPTQQKNILHQAPDKGRALQQALTRYLRLRPER